MWRFVQLLTGWFGYVLASLILMAYFAVGLKPFHWDPPRQVSNGAKRDVGRTLSFASPGLAVTREPALWFDAAVLTGGLRVKLRVRAYLHYQRGPARIFTVSANPKLRNITVAQEKDDLVIRLRTSVASPNGLPEHHVDGVFASSDWRDIELTIADRQLSVLLDGNLVLNKSLPEEPLASWDPAFRLGLGNELTGDRPWLGEIAQAHVETGGRKFDYLAPGALDLPSRFWIGPKFQVVSPPGERLEDVSLNFVCFVPFGFVLAAALAQKGSMIVRATVLCAAASLSVEMAQVFFAYRMPCVSDWAANTSGAAVGASLAWTSWRPQPGNVATGCAR